jgi:hypothetical protein
MVEQSLRIAVCTLRINEWYREIIKYGARTMEMYCLNNDYDLIVEDETTKNGVYTGSNKRLPPWYKIKLLLKYMIDKYDYLVWIDADTQILNINKRLEYFIYTYQKDKDIFIGSDNKGILTSSVIFVKNSKRSKEILEMVWDNPNWMNFELYEQDSFVELYEKNIDNVRDNIQLLPGYMQNEFLTYWYSYIPNECFIYHAARCSHLRDDFAYMMDMFCPVKIREESIENYLDRLYILKTNERFQIELNAWCNNIRLRSSIRKIQN